MTPSQGGSDHVRSQPWGRWHSRPEAPHPPGARGATAAPSPFAEPLQGTATILGRRMCPGRAAAARPGAHGGVFIHLAVRRRANYSLENPTSSFDFKLLLNRARVQLPTPAKGSKYVCGRRFAASSSLPGTAQPVGSRARTAWLGANPSFAWKVPSEGLQNW